MSILQKELDMHNFSNLFYAYLEPRGFISKRLKTSLSERKLLGLSFGIAIFSFISNLIDLLFSSNLYFPREEVSRLISSYFAIALFFVPIFLYMISGFFHFILWLVYKIKSMPLSRLSFFWALFLCMPFQIIVTIFTKIFENDLSSTLLNLAMLIYFIWLWTVFDCVVFKVEKLVHIFILKLSIFIASFSLVLIL